MSFNSGISGNYNRICTICRKQDYFKNFFKYKKMYTNVCLQCKRNGGTIAEPVEYNSLDKNYAALLERNPTCQLKEYEYVNLKQEKCSSCARKLKTSISKIWQNKPYSNNNAQVLCVTCKDAVHGNDFDRLEKFFRTR